MPPPVSAAPRPSNPPAADAAETVCATTRPMPLPVSTAPRPSSPAAAEAPDAAAAAARPAVRPACTDAAAAEPRGANRRARADAPERAETGRHPARDGDDGAPACSHDGDGCRRGRPGQRNQAGRQRMKSSTGAVDRALSTPPVARTTAAPAVAPPRTTAAPPVAAERTTPPSPRVNAAAASRIPVTTARSRREGASSSGGQKICGAAGQCAQALMRMRPRMRDRTCVEAAAPDSGQTPASSPPRGRGARWARRSGRPARV